jgi:hypothetical protein
MEWVVRLALQEQGYDDEDEQAKNQAKEDLVQWYARSPVHHQSLYRLQQNNHLLRKDLTLT